MNTQAVGSWNPEDFTQGGFFDDKDATIVKAEVVEFDYQGQADAICALAVTLREDGETDAENDRTEYYKIGELSKFVPSADRKSYVPVGTTTAMNKNAKAALFLKALFEKGFPMSKLAGGINGLEGVHGHVNIMPLPEMKGIDKKDLKILLFTTLTDAPAGATAAKPKSSGGTKKKDAPATTTTAQTGDGGGNSEAEEKAVEIIVGLIGEKGGKLNKTLIPAAMFQKIPATQGALRNAAVGFAGKTDWLSSPDRPWQYNNGELSFGG